MNFWNKILVMMLLMAAFIPGKAFSQGENVAMLADYGSLSGFVKDDDSKETLIGATIFIEGTKLGARSNKNGFFSITSIPPGDYTVNVTFIGYEKYSEKYTFEKGKPIQKNIFLKKSSVMTDEVSVTAEREIEKREISISKVNIPVDQLKEIRIGGESDVFRSLQMLPGVLTSSQISSGLYIRGGSPDQNLVLLDNSAVYNPTHLFGFISTFNTTAIKDVELIKGGFPAEYGGRMSSVLNITQKDGTRDGYHGTGAIGLISSRLSLEGPTPWKGGSFFVGGRRTYFELIKAGLEDDPESPIPNLNFYDLNLKYAQDIGFKDKVFISGFTSADNFNSSQSGIEFDLNIGNKLLSARWNHIFADDLFSVVNVSVSNYFNEFDIDQSGYKILINNDITDYTAKGSLEWFASDKLTTKAGFEINKFDFGYLQNFSGDTDSTVSGEGGQIDLEVEEWNYSGYAQMNYQFSDMMSLQAGLRTNYWKLSEELTFDPRLAWRWQMTDDIAVKLAYGIFHQNLRLASLQDFSFFDTWLPTDSTVPVSRADHYIASVETSPWPGWDLNVDVYYKKLYNINEVNQTSLEGETVSDVLYVGDGEAYGAELFLQKKFGDITGWFGYGYGVIWAQFDSINNGDRFHPKYDRTHDFKAVLQYTGLEKWDFSATFTYQTGQSYTGATSRMQSRLPGQNEGFGKVFPSQRYGLRLPPSHQLNVSASYKFKTFGEKSRLILDIYNVYSRRDILFRFYDTSESVTTVEDVRLLPIIPTITYEIEF